ncbi:PstS family phosphate ABC transporter substrate-binding protein [Acaryochloris sp. IP29b_bin.137]|uniref:PstS family phosphate ABC transporter substrate-binding protein n=1 Tax=Acaryochloris sp. IP29b_bin.137 TaxID=2969217 RepID=UPI00262A9E71|nr:PstS family phosphate ABC transporter substrate-binding protein [Acaryochloris sp. IP29b_bin.137]
MARLGLYGLPKTQHQACPQFERIVFTQQQPALLTLMYSASKSVLLLQPLKFQAQVWTTALQSQQIEVIEEPTEITFSRLAGQRDAIERANIGLLLVDLGAQHLNAFDICRWYHENYPDLKLILTAGLRKKVLATERRLALEQGAEDFFPGFQQDNILPAAISRVKRILELLKYHPLVEKDLIDDLMAFYRHGAVPAYQLPTPTQMAFATARQSCPVDFEENPQTSTIILPERAYSVQRLPDPEPSQPTAQPAAPRNTKLSKFYLKASLVALLLLIAGFWGWLRSPRQLQLSPSQGAATLALTPNFAEVPDVPEGLYNYGGSATWALIRPNVEDAIADVYPNLQLRYVETVSGTPGSGQGIKMLLDGKIDFTQSTRPLNDEEYAIATTRGFKITQHAIGLDGIAVVVHPSLNVPGLTVPQLRQIYLGNISNWNQLGGPDRTITPFSRQPGDSGTADYFQEYVLQNEPFSSTVVPIYSTTDALRQLNRTNGGIYYASAAEVLYQCIGKPIPLGLSSDKLIPPQQGASTQNCPSTRNQPNLAAFRDGSYPLTRPLYVIVKENKDREQLIGEAYTDMMLSEQGQQLIEQAGFVRIE